MLCHAILTIWSDSILRSLNNFLIINYMYSSTVCYKLCKVYIFHKLINWAHFKSQKLSKARNNQMRDYQMFTQRRAGQRPNKAFRCINSHLLCNVVWFSEKQMHLKKSNTKLKIDTKILSDECWPRNLLIYISRCFQNICIHHHIVKTILIASVRYFTHEIIAYYSDFYFALNDIVSNCGR